MKPLLILTLLATTLYADIDLAPRVAMNRFDGFVASRLEFSDGAQKVAISLDSDAQVSAIDGGTAIRFGELPHASVRIHRSPFATTVAFDAEGLRDYQRAALRMLPPSAEGIVREEATANPESINGGQSYRFTFSYTIARAPMRESVLFLNITPTQQIVVQVGAYAQDFEAATQRAVRMIRDWHPTTTAEEKGIN